MMKQTSKNLEDFACDGLRTLIIASKTIPNEDYEDWAVRYKVLKLLNSN